MSIGPLEVALLLMFGIPAVIAVVVIVFLTQRSSTVAKQPPALAAAAWFPDPTGRHEYRYWDGSVWTATVSDSGVLAEDPL